jgi:hypothetical protein
MTRGAAARLQPESLGCCGVQADDPTPRQGQERSSLHCLGTQPTASAALAQTLLERWLWRWREGGVGEVKRILRVGALLGLQCPNSENYGDPS